MKWNSLVALCCAAIALGLAGQGARGQDSSVPYISGGISEESRAEMQSRAGQFDLQVVFALRSGEYLSGVEIVVRDALGARLVSTVAIGPWFYANVPPGSYEITAALGAQTLTQRFSVPARGHRQLVLRFVEE